MVVLFTIFYKTMVLYRYWKKFAFEMKYFKKKTEKTLVLKYP